MSARKFDEAVKPLFFSIGIEFTQMSKADHDHLQKNLRTADQKRNGTVQTLYLRYARA